MNPFHQISNNITLRMNEIFQDEIMSMEEQINKVARTDGLQFIIECPKVKMKFTIKPIQSNVKQESRGEKGRTKKVGTKKGRIIPKKDRGNYLLGD